MCLFQPHHWKAFTQIILLTVCYFYWSKKMQMIVLQYFKLQMELPLKNEVGIKSEKP